jgi:hypothetical protein
MGQYDTTNSRLIYIIQSLKILSVFVRRKNFERNGSAEEGNNILLILVIIFWHNIRVYWMVLMSSYAWRTLLNQDEGGTFPMSDTRYPLRDGFQVRGEVFSLPKDLYKLDSRTQYDVEICNLFVNERFTISDIVEVTRGDSRTIVKALL